jgi:hypothetical protein
MLTPDSYREKEAVKVIVADLVATCLWHPEVAEAHGETVEHDIKAWREEGIVKAEVKRKLN